MIDINSSTIPSREDQQSEIEFLRQTLAKSANAFSDLRADFLRVKGEVRGLFNSAFESADDDEDLTISLDDINALLVSIGVTPLVRVKDYEVAVSYSVTGTIVVRAASEDEARSMVEDSEICLEYDGTCEYVNFETYDATLEVESVTVS